MTVGPMPKVEHHGDGSRRSHDRSSSSSSAEADWKSEAKLMFSELHEEVIHTSRQGMAATRAVRDTLDRCASTLEKLERGERRLFALMDKSERKRTRSPREKRAARMSSDRKLSPTKFAKVNVRRIRS